MGWIQAVKRFVREQYTGTGLGPAAGPPEPRARRVGSQSGIALFMVIAAVSILSIVVTEFTYIAQVNQKIAFDGLDQLKAHYLAKTGLKLSLLRLKAYQHIKKYVASQGAMAKMVPQSLIDRVWSFPFFYPFPTNLPGMTPSDKEKIQAFEKASLLEGKFSAVIESESGKYNLNLLLAGFVPKPSPNPSASPTPPPGGPGGGFDGSGPGGPDGRPSPTPEPFDAQKARESLKTYLGELMRPKMENDPAWADAYRDPHLLDDLIDNIAGWADRTYERRSQTGDIPMKRAPFYNVSELHMIPGMDDDLYNLFSPNLTVVRTQGINVNTMKEATLKALFPDALPDEVAEFFKARDSQEEDGTFKDEAGFLKYIKEHFSVYGRGNLLDQRKEYFTKNNIRFVTEETEFKVTVQASLNQSTRLIEAWVTLGPPAAPKTPAQPNSNVNNQTPPGQAPPGPQPAADSGLKIHFMRVL